MIYYGLQVLNPSIFLAACVVICSIISVATGSSWTTSATVGIALIGIGDALGISLGMTAGAVVSGAYFGDKMSPLSDTTNLAPAMAGTDLFSHIRYMMLTTVPSIVITLILFLIIGFNLTTKGVPDTTPILSAIDEVFYVTPWLFLVPALVIFMIVRKTQPLIALLIGTLLGGLFAIIFQPEIVAKVAGASVLDFQSAYQGVMNAITVDTSIVTSNEQLNDLFSAGGIVWYACGREKAFVLSKQGERYAEPLIRGIEPMEMQSLRLGKENIDPWCKRSTYEPSCLRCSVKVCE